MNTLTAPEYMHTYSRRKMLGKFRLVANSPLPTDPLPVVVSVAIVKGKVFKVRCLVSNFHDKWERVALTGLDIIGI
jgi:hypothetical protein